MASNTKYFIDLLAGLNIMSVVLGMFIGHWKHSIDIFVIGSCSLVYS
jgi:hypothetical protein